MTKSFFTYKSLDSGKLSDLFKVGRKTIILYDGSGRMMNSKESDGDSTTYFVDDTTGAWSPEDDNLRIEGTFSFNNNPSLLFDTENGILGDNGTAGIACDWIAKQSSVRGTFLLNSPIRKNSSPKEFKYSFVFPKGIIKGEVLFSFYFYVFSKDTRTLKLPAYIANEEGIRLGEFYSFSLFFDGDGSLFPVVDYDGNPGDPLWKMTFEFNDPAGEILSENTCCLHINRAHKAYDDLMGKRQGGSDSFLFKEIMASAIQLLIENAFLKDPDLKKHIDEGERFDIGTIAFCISRFQNDLGIKTTSPPEILAASIREYLES